MNQILDRLKIFIAHIGTTPRAFALKINFNYSTLNNYLTGRRTTIDLDLITKTISSFEELSAEWLMRGKGEMIIGSEQPNTSAETTPISDRESALIDTIAMQQETIHSLKDKVKTLEAELIIANSRNRIV